MKILFLIFLFFVSFSCFASSALNVNTVVVSCPKSESCEERKGRFANLTGDYRSVVHLRDTMRIMASDGGYQYFTYRLVKRNNLHELQISFKLKPIIREIDIGFVDRNLESDPAQLINLKEGEFFEMQKLESNLEIAKRRLEALGYPKNQVNYEIVEKSSGVNIYFHVTLGPPLIFKSVKSNAASSFVAEFLEKKFYNLYNKPFEMNKFKNYLDTAQRELFSYGYYLINLEFTPVIKGNRVTLNIQVSNDRLFAFDFRNIKKEDHDVLQAIVVDLFRKYKRPLSESIIRQALLDHYQKRALLNAQIRIESSKFRNRFMETLNLYRIFIDEDGKTRLKKVNFLGNNHFSGEKLHSMFDKEAFELASIGYYDEEYFNYFVDYLRSQYIQSGFVQVKIQGPNKNFTNEKKQAVIEYIIQEGPRAIVDSINFDQLPSEFEAAVLKELANKSGKPFNPIALVEDIKKVTNIMQENGYYYAEVVNANEDSLATYNRTGSEVDINFKINLGPLVKLNRVLILGNNKTRKKVLLKKIPLEEGDLITPSKTRDIESAMSATGLFTSVNVEPLRHNSQSAATDLIVRVMEREYGLVEIAPGYRTDLGLKLTGTVSYLNIGGMNRALTLRSQINRRLDFQTLDPDRIKNKNHLLEHNTSATFTQGDIFNTDIDYNLGVSYQRRRFFAFDADIQRVNNTLTRDLSKTLSVSLRQQLERIDQYNAVETNDAPENLNGNYRIGSVTPVVTWDLRNSQINPTSGAFFNLSCEIANPYLLSQRDDDLTVDYYKFVSRNRFYIPFRNGTVAISAVAGVQENLAKNRVVRDGLVQTEGSIPPIKVFRLTGMDIVRGFDDREINRLSSGRELSRLRVEDKAYLANFKFEPRYFLSDTFMGGVFYDAGRVYVDEVDLGDLRQSVGITFKLLTPVGTLDFDYGIKLLRKRGPDGKLEDPGRFHVSIGFF